MEPRPRSRRSTLPRWAPRTDLDIALRHGGGARSTPFIDVIEARRSIRELGRIAPDELGPLLWYSARVRRAGGADGWQSRNAPSAGGLHPVELFVVPHPDVEVFHYDPVRHVLGRLAGIAGGSLAKVCNSSRSILTSNEGALIYLACDQRRSEACYENAESLLWRDAGCVIATLQLVATWLKLGACPLGLLGEGLGKFVAPDLIPVGMVAIGRLRRALG